MGLSPNGGRCVHEAPSSRLTKTPSISTPTHVTRESSGSITMLVTLGGPAKHSLAIGIASFSQLRPAARERNKLGGFVPASRSSGFAGCQDVDQICIPSIGESTNSQVAPLSWLRYRPASEPARR